jgi:cysteine desulfurase family protein (TIGR01976 family)
MDDAAIATLRARFPALARTSADGRPLVFADAPGGSQTPDTVIDAIAGHLRHGVSNTHGAFGTSRATDRLIAEAHVAAADLLGADPDEIVFGANTTTLLLHLSRSFARTIGPGDEIVVTRLDHDANIRPWVLAADDAGATVRWVDVCDDDATLDEASFDAALNDRTKLVAFTLASNAVGTITPAAALIRHANDVGAIVAVDGVHLAQHRSIDLRALGADLVTSSPYKYFGPHQGVLAARRAILDAWRPYKLRPVDDTNPDRWETGTQNHEAMAGTIAAIDYIASIGTTYGTPIDATRRAAIRAGFHEIAEHERALAIRFLEGVAGIDRIRLYGIATSDRVDERTPTFALRIGDEHPMATAEALGDRGIFVWDGHYYAIELYDRLGLNDTGGAVRIGFCHYHTTAEVDRVLDTLADLARRA